MKTKTPQFPTRNLPHLVILWAGLLFVSLALPGYAANKWFDCNSTTAGGGDPCSGNISGGANWSSSDAGTDPATWVSGDTAVFSAGTPANTTATANSSITAAGIIVEDGKVVIGGSAGITIGAGPITVNSGATLSINSSVRISATAGSVITINGGTVEDTNPGAAGSFVDVDQTIVLNGGGTLSFTVAGVLNIVQTTTTITGTGPLTKEGDGILAIASACTYSGATIINHGTLRIRSATNRLPTGTDVTINSPGVFDPALNQTVKTVNGNGAITYSGSATLTINGGSGNNSTITGNITDGASFGNITKSGAGILTLGGANTYDGIFTLSAGTCTVNSGATLCGPAGDVVVNGGTMNLNNTAQTVENLSGTGGTINLGTGHTLTSIAAASVAFSGKLSGPGGFKYNTPGFAQTLSGSANDYSGDTTITAGQIILNATSTLGSGAGTLHLSGGTLTASASRTVTIDNPIDVTANSAITTTSAASTPQLDLTTGIITAAAGTTLTFRNDGADAATDTFQPRFSGNGFTYGEKIAIDNGPTGKTMLQSYNTTGTDQTFSGIISGSGGYTRNASTAGSGGRTIFSGANTYSGGTIVSRGTLLVNNVTGSGTGTGTVTVGVDGILGGGGEIAGATTVNGTLSPGASIGTLTFDSTLTLSGTTSMEINKTAATADKIVMSGGTVTLGGNLTVVQLDANPFVLGDTFQLISGTMSGTFSSFTLPALPTGLKWDAASPATTQLKAGGTGYITVICDGTLTASAGPDKYICSGCGGVAIGGSPTASGGSGTYSYSWTPNDGTLSSTTDPNPTASPTTTTLYTVTVTDSLGCTVATSSMTVNLNVAPTISSQPANTTACDGSTASFSVTATGSGLNYSWATNNNAGWGSAWTVTGTSGGTWIGDSTVNENGGGVCTTFAPIKYDINSPVGGKALGMWSSAGDEAATRAFTPLTVGQVVSIDFDNGSVDTGSKVGFSLQTAGGAADVLQFYFLGGAINYKYWDDVGFEQDTLTIPWQNTGLRVQFALTCANTYVLTVTPCGGSPTTFTGTYSGAAIAQLKLFNGNMLGGDPNNCYFNNFIVGGYTDNADNYSGSDYAGVDQGNEPIAVGNGSSTYTTPALSLANSGAQYQVVISGCAGVVVSTAASVTVNAKSADPTSATAGASTICNGESTTLTLNGGGGGTGETIQWYTGSCGGTAAGTGNGASVSPTTTTTYYGRYEDGAPCNYQSACATVTVTVNAKSADPTSATAAADTICNGGSTTLTLNGGGGGTGETIQWYTGSCGGTAVGSGNGLSVSPTATTTYYGRYEDGAPCSYNSACAQVTVTVNQTSADPTSATAGAGTICNGGSTTLTLNGGGGGTGETIQWYTGSCGGTAVGSGDGLSVSPTVTTTYYGRYEDGAPCSYNSACAQVTVTVNQKSADPTSATAGAGTICNGGSTTLTLNGGGGGTGETIQWYTGSCGGTSVGSGNGLSVSPTATTTYYGRYEDGAPCNYNSACAQVTVTVNQTSADPTSATAGAGTICNGGSTTLTLNGGGGGTGETIQWYTGSCGGTSVGSGNGLSVSPTATTTYYGRYEDGAPCNYNSACATVTVTVNQKSADPTSATAGASTICNGGSTTLTLNGGGGGTGETIQWYTGSCGGTSVGSGNGLSVSPTATTTYYGRYEDGAPCNYQSACATVTVTVNAKSADPTSATAGASLICSGGSTTLTLNGGGGGTGETIQWYTGSCGGTAVGSGNGLSVSPTATTTYYGRYEDGAPCNYNSACAQVTVTIIPQPDITSITLSGTDVVLVWNSMSGVNYQVQYTTDLSPTITWTDLGSPVAGTGGPATYTDTSGLGAKRFYRISVVCP